MENKFLLMLGKNISLELVKLYLDRAKTSVISFTGLSENEVDSNACLENIIVDLALYRYNLAGSEYLNSEGYNGNSFSYSLDIPKFLKSELNRYKRMRVI